MGYVVKKKPLKAGPTKWSDEDLAAFVAVSSDWVRQKAGLQIARPTEWSTEDVAKYMDVSPDYVYRQAKAGKIPGFKIAGRWRFDPRVIMTWYEAQKRSPGLAVVPAPGGAR